jgi:hypothetical protein
MYISLRVSYRLLLSDFNNTKISNFMQIRSVGTDLFHADRLTDMKKLIVAFRKFPNPPKNYSLLCKHTCMAKHSKRVNYLFSDILGIWTFIQLNTPYITVITHT